MSNPIMLDQSDVEIRLLDDPACAECGRPETHGVWLDLRSNGYSTAVYTGCEPCCEEFADRLEQSLPPKKAKS